MMEFLSKVVNWGPVFFGVLVFAPMWAAAMEATGLAFPFGPSNLVVLMLVGGLWGVVAKLRGRWL
jgi:hypothetical protein